MNYQKATKILVKSDNILELVRQAFLVMMKLKFEFSSPPRKN